MQIILNKFPIHYVQKHPHYVQTAPKTMNRGCVGLREELIN